MDSAKVNPVDPVKKYKKEQIPKAVKEQVWLRDMGKIYEGKCKTSWCQNKVTVFDFQAGHNIAESKGGPTTLDNLVVICSRCNLSMASNYTFTEWSSQYKGQGIKRYFSCVFTGIK
jgi:5-methylcytosine-specific restriction endonuclease McrA